MAKKAKKYDLSRGDIAEQLSGLVEELRNIDTFESSPSDVVEQIGTVVEQLEDLADRVSDEA